MSACAQNSLITTALIIAELFCIRILVVLALYVTMAMFCTVVEGAAKVLY